MSVRAKFRCNAVTDFGNGSKKVELSPVYQGSKPDDENTGFNKATPSGRLEMQIDNPKASVQFEPGQSYYLDFTPAD
ncbi:MAG: hypothetical protein E5V24_13520 [Mesorhizobium sp.]|nr:MAG: hypothetical protein E5V24_13520 [Mesorhizobium sp.]